MRPRTNAPDPPSARPRFRQRIRYVSASDGTRLAWAESGSGPIVVKAANWLTHLEYEWQSPVWKHWLEFFSGQSRFVRFDERGCGMSDRDLGTLSLDQWCEDMDTVVRASQAVEPVTLLGISQGAAICLRYAALHPERVSRLILYGGYARGADRRGTAESRAAYRAMLELMRVAWFEQNETFRQVFTSRFIPGGTPEQLRWYNDLCVKTTTGEAASRLLTARADIDISDVLGAVRVPTLVLHARGDEVIPLEEGRLLASRIPGAEFVELDSRNHILLEHEPAWQRFCEVVRDFLGQTSTRAEGTFAALSTRERAVLGLLCEGLANAQIATRLHISEKTVRNHASNLFDKLGVWSRSQAIAFARDHGFRG